MNKWLVVDLLKVLEAQDVTSRITAFNDPLSASNKVCVLPRSTQIHRMQLKIWNLHGVTTY